MLFLNRRDGTFIDAADRWGIAVKDQLDGGNLRRLRQRRRRRPLSGPLTRAEPLLRERGQPVRRSQRRPRRRQACRTSSLRSPRSTTTATACSIIYVSTYASDAMRTDLMEIRGMSMTEMLADRRAESQVLQRGPLADFLDPADTELLLEYRTARHARLPRLPQRVRAAERAVPQRRRGTVRRGQGQRRAARSSATRTRRRGATTTTTAIPTSTWRTTLRRTICCATTATARFTDVTDETGTADIGFGMGVSLGRLRRRRPPGPLRLQHVQQGGAPHHRQGAWASIRSSPRWRAATHCSATPTAPSTRSAGWTTTPILVEKAGLVVGQPVRRLRQRRLARHLRALRPLLGAASRREPGRHMKLLLAHGRAHRCGPGVRRGVAARRSLPGRAEPRRLA